MRVKERKKGSEIYTSKAEGKIRGNDKVNIFGRKINSLENREQFKHTKKITNLVFKTYS